ncbi:hypothetical protein TRICI_002972 [Trichomonascus ciferrii]|uniref:RING-type domain-containing protein n=1 Tax=Trichomonascus ciferrii TaxID=44093 RepID=A0A642VAE2_9ASCO|nr:hypothetical protein TRICI_002972 [Trichomonascus ciferrii]
MADERNGEASSHGGGEAANGRWPPHSFYVLNYSFTLPAQQGQGQGQQQSGDQQPQQQGPRMTFPIFGPAGGVFVMNQQQQQQQQQQQRGEGPMEGVEFGFEINAPQGAGHPFANLFGHTHKPRASERAIAKLRELSRDELGEGESACPICFDKYDLVSRDELRNNGDEDDPPVSVPGQTQTQVQEAHVTIESEDPEESVPERMEADPAESAPEAQQERETQEDPAESVPMDEEPEDTADPETSVPEPSADDPPESVPESGQQSDHRPVELPCGHRFGQSCIKEWLGSSNTCPLCRTPLESQDEYLRSTGQEPEGAAGFGSGVLDFIFQQVPEVFNIIRREVYNNHNNNNSNDSTNDNNNNDNDDSSNDHSNSNDRHDTNHEHPPPRPFHVHIVRDEDGVYRTHTHHEQPQAQPPPPSSQSQSQPEGRGPEQQQDDAARHTFISGNTMSELLRAFTTPPPPGEQQGGFPFRISRIFNTAINTSSRNRESRHHPYTRTSNNNGDSDNRDLQCASLPLSLCVGDSESEPIFRLDCGHGYHDGCLRMAMRAHGDGHRVDTNHVWCTCCRRYQTIIN